jgi:N6-L-threonylcarbamoyladenine synthase
MSYLGIDTSNYTTSLSLVRDGRVVCNLKKSVYVAEHQRGVRQSDALFCHVKNLPLLMEELGATHDLEAIGYSARPRDVEGSYMPCFLAGELVARTLAANRGLPLYAFSHQAGHVRAALYSAGATHLIGKRFLAFHVSGGTTELLLCEGDQITLVGGTEDLTAGQAIDRIGVKMGLSFPCGAALEKLATGREATAGKISVKGLSCNLSGLENRAEKMLSEGATKEEVAAFTIEFVRKTLQKLTENAFEVYGKLPVLYAGGVMSCQIIKKDFEKRFGGYFAQPAFSADNACGVALLAEESHHKGAEVAE